MSEIICPKCHAQSPEGAFYCYHCAQPLRCKGCEALLVPNARACIQCGQLIPERSGNEQFQVEAPLVLPGYSRLKIHETPEVRDLDLVVANEAIEHIKDFFPSLAGGRPLGQFKSAVDAQTQQTALVEVDTEIPSSRPQLPAATQSPQAATEPPAEQRIWEIFKEREGKLIQDIRILKAPSKSDYIVRLASLFLRAHEMRGEDSVPRDEVFRMLDKANVKSTSRSNILYTSGIHLENDMLSLTLEARHKVQQYIADIFNPAVPDGWYPGGPTRSTNGHVKKPAKRGSERHTRSDALVAEWAVRPKTQELNQEFPQTITGAFSTEDQALFGLYCLDKVGVTAEVSPTQLSKFLHTACQLDVSADNIRFRKALKNKPPYVSHRDDGSGYRITISGIAYVEQLLQSSKQ